MLGPRDQVRKLAWPQRMRNSVVRGHFHGRAELILVKNAPFRVKIDKNGSARPQKLPRNAEIFSFFEAMTISILGPNTF